MFGKNEVRSEYIMYFAPLTVGKVFSDESIWY